MTERCALSSPVGSYACSPTSTTSEGCTMPSSSMGLDNLPDQAPGAHSHLRQERPEAKQRSVATSIAPAVAKALMGNVGSGTSVVGAESLDTFGKTVMQTRNERFGFHPKYLRRRPIDSSSRLSPTTATWSETAFPLPRPLFADLNNPIANSTISKHPDLFAIVSPIKVDVFESYLATHPNRPFVESVCMGLREGFWPWANTRLDGYPDTYDASKPTPKDPDKAAFLRAQRDVEISKNRFSHLFGPDLLPGMHSAPIHAVPKSDGTGLRMVTDHSSGDYSLNSMIAHDYITGYPLDNMRHVGEFLLHARASLPPNTQLTMWKSDIAEAYRLCPMHPLWQIHQINTIDGQCYVDRNNTFGSSASGAIFIAVNSLVAWIAVNILHFDYLGTYVDDSFGVDVAGDVEFYHPYETSIPKHQKRLLDLWDELGIPHKQKKQVHGCPLTIIGIDVDPNNMTFTLPPAAKQHLIDELKLWSTEPPKKVNGALPPGVRLHVHFKLRQWLQLEGWLNWGFNVYLLLKPCLNLLYAKTSGKYIPDKRIYTNNAIHADLRWALNHICGSRGVEVLNSRQWGPDDADIVIYCDASLVGLGFWVEKANIGFFVTIPKFAEDGIQANKIIFHYEALCLVSALSHVHLSASDHSRILIYTDNSNVFDVFNSFRANANFNEMLKCAADILIGGDHSLRVIHIPGIDNIVADALSRGVLIEQLPLRPS